MAGGSSAVCEPRLTASCSQRLLEESWAHRSWLTWFTCTMPVYPCQGCVLVVLLFRKPVPLLLASHNAKDTYVQLTTQSSMLVERGHDVAVSASCPGDMLVEHPTATTALLSMMMCSMHSHHIQPRMQVFLCLDSSFLPHWVNRQDGDMRNLGPAQPRCPSCVDLGSCDRRGCQGAGLLPDPLKSL